MPPVVIAAGIGAAGAIGGAVLSSNAQKSAAQQATDATTAANNQAVQAQLQLGNQSLDLQRQMYNNSTGLQTQVYNQGFNALAPYAANGVPASNAINSLLGLPKATPLKSTVTAPPPIAPTGPVTQTGATGPVPGAPVPNSLTAPTRWDAMNKLT
jgi:hypothetical protein